MYRTNTYRDRPYTATAACHSASRLEFEKVQNPAVRRAARHRRCDRITVPPLSRRGS